MKLLKEYVFNTKTRQFQTWADWILDAIEDKDIDLKQDVVNEYMRGAK